MDIIKKEYTSGDAVRLELDVSKGDKLPKVGDIFPLDKLEYQITYIELKYIDRNDVLVLVVEAERLV